MTTFDDFKAKRSEIIKITEDYQELLRKSLAEFWLKYVESFEFPSDSFLDKNGKSHSFVKLLSGGYSTPPESVHVDIHNGISVIILTVLDNSDLNNLIEERFHLKIRVVNGLVNYNVTELGFFDEKIFESVLEEKDYIEVIDYIKSEFMNRILKDFPGVQENLDSE